MTIWTFYAAVLGLIGVIVGALGDHLIHIQPGTLTETIYTTALQYQMWHVIVLFILGVYAERHPLSNILKLSCWLFLLGIILFSGGIYLKILLGIYGFSYLVPFGGASLMLAWLFLAIGVVQNYRSNGVE